jgi:hypothetical protein
MRSVAATSILLALASILFTGLGVLLLPVPIAGAVFAFGAPALALGGVITGGLALSRAKREKRATDSATVGVVLNALCVVPALLIALTCGVCNALCSSAGPDGRLHWSVQHGMPGPRPSRPSGPPAPPAPPAQPGDPAAPPPAFPPPPLPAGPGQP